MEEYEKIDTYKNFQYAVWLNTKKGYRCGYIKIPENHVLYEKQFDEFECSIDSVMLTFSGHIKGLSGWFIGFDHNHLYDGVDEDAIRKYHPDNADFYINDAYSYHDGRYNIYATLDTVIEECQNVIDELITKYN